MKILKYFGSLSLVLVLLSLTSFTAGEKETKRIENAAEVLREFGRMKESIPADLLKIAQGIIVIPKMINAGLAVGGKHGKGVAMVKTASGKWSNPVFVSFTGGSFGFQAGVQSVDLVLVVKRKSTLTEIGNGDFTLGGDISVTAGPVGRSSTASTNVKLDAEVYSYSRSKGLFAGLSVNGASLSVDKAANANFYGSDTSAEELFSASVSSDQHVVSLRKALSAF